MKFIDIIGTTPDERTDLVLDSFNHMVIRIELLTAEFKILEQWFIAMPDNFALGTARIPTIADSKKLKASIKDFSEKHDAYSAQFMAVCNGIQAMYDAAIFYTENFDEE